MQKNLNIISKIFVVTLCVAGLYYINSTGIGLSKFGGSFEGAIDKASDGGGAINQDAGSNYPTWMVLKGSVSDLLIIPIRFVGFLFAPLIPFLVRSASHAIGLLDALFYLVVFYNIFKNRIIHKRSDMSKYLIIVIMTMVFTFSFGASNFGTNIRHRAKIVPIIIMVPFITRNERNRILRAKNINHK